MRTLAVCLLALAVASCGGDKKRPSHKPGHAGPGGAMRAGQPTGRPAPRAAGAGELHGYPPVVTVSDLRERGREMLKALTRQYQPGPAQYRKNFQTACRIINRAFKARGVSLERVRCDVINHPSFNANTLPGGIIVATTTLVAGYTNLAAAQVLYSNSMKDYLAYNDALAKAIAAGTPPDKLPLPACPGGGAACLAKVAQSRLFKARVTGLLTAIAAHEYGHVRAGHVLNEFLRQNVEQFNTRAFRQMTGKQVDRMFHKLQGVAMNQVDEYQADEMAARYLAICYQYTKDKYGDELRDKTAGPHPMDAFYTLWFLMSLDQASKAAGKDTPAFQKNHPPARLRAQRVLQVIIRNHLPSAAMAGRAYAILFKKKK